LSWLPKTLSGRTAITVALALMIFMIFSLGTAIYFIAIPMAQRSADDFAAVVVTAAHAFASLPQESREALRQRLLEDHGLIVTTQHAAVSERSYDVPYYRLFRGSLAKKAGQELKLVESVKGPLLWVDVPADDATIRIGFDKQRIGANPPVVLLMAIAGGALLTWLVSMMEVRRVGRPLERLSAAVNELGRGNNPAPISEEGPQEVAALARAFNRMSSDIQEMAENRTVIVAGISHDLRTPLTRLELAVEMLDADSDPQLVAGIRRDLAAMNGLIGQFLSFTKGLDDARPVELALCKVIEAQATDLRRVGAEVHLHDCAPPCRYVADPVALERVLANLLENAAHYGAGAPIDVRLHCDDDAVTIDICDRGPGIPQDQTQAVFRPFHRLEAARQSRTGGSGLGLAIARQLAIKHGWSIALLPREGGGTIARVTMPAAGRR